MDNWFLKSDTKNYTYPTKSSSCDGTRNSTHSFLETGTLSTTEKFMVRKYNH
jgi:hypothetical protein